MNILKPRILFILIILVAVGIIVIPILNRSQNQQCIIMISGNKYDVSSLQKNHSGGNVFICGSDMTEQYKDEHGRNLSRIEQYLVE